MPWKTLKLYGHRYVTDVVVFWYYRAPKFRKKFSFKSSTLGQRFSIIVCTLCLYENIYCCDFDESKAHYSSQFVVCSHLYFLCCSIKSIAHLLCLARWNMKEENTRTLLNSDVSRILAVSNLHSAPSLVVKRKFVKKNHFGDLLILSRHPHLPQNLKIFHAQ